MDVLYLRNLPERLGFAQKDPTQVFEDNTACIEWGNNVIGGRERAKHIDIRKHFAHEVIQNGNMRLSYESPRRSSSRIPSHATPGACAHPE